MSISESMSRTKQTSRRSVRRSSRLTMSTVWVLFAVHLAALTFGLLGILVALPNPHLWADSRFGADAFSFGMTYGGSLHIIFGAAVMLLFGGLVIGWRKTLIFFAVTTVLSLSSELIGTGTGWPFGNYEYTSGLGYKVLGRVPFTIPLSWFYVGFASYLLANVIAARWGGWKQAAIAVVGGAYLLTVWDLVLDPAMAHESLAIQFWVWFETGPYFGMPLKNFAGWTLTALLFMGISRALWRRDVSPRQYSATLPFAVYLANMLFAFVLSLSVGLWEPVIIALVLGVVPAALAWRADPPTPDITVAPPYNGNRPERRPSEAVGVSVMRSGAKVLLSRRVDLHVEGLEHLPATGPALLAARHFHHLYDGCALLTTSPRPLHIVVGLDWIRGQRGRTWMERACAMVRWPVVLRDERLSSTEHSSAYTIDEAPRYALRAMRESVALLRAGEVLVVFPEGYPNIDPTWTPKQGQDDLLSLRDGFVRIVEMAQRDGVTRIPIVPIGFDYEETASDNWRVTMRIGSPVVIDPNSTRVEVVKVVEEQVRLLSSRSVPAVVSASLLQERPTEVVST